MGWWQINADTLARSRFVLSPLAETFACLKLLHAGTAAHPGERAWLDAHLPAYRRRLAADPVTARLVRSGLGREWIADFLTPTPREGESFEGAVARVRSAVPAHARAHLARSLAGPLPAALDRDDLPERAAALLEYVWAEAVRPDWGRRRRVLEADVVARTAQVGRGGWAAVLDALRPGTRWLGDSRLQVNLYEYPPREISGAELILVPVTVQRHGWVSWEEPERYAVVYPCGGALVDPAPRPGGPRHPPRPVPRGGPGPPRHPDEHQPTGRRDGAGVRLGGPPPTRPPRRGPGGAPPRGPLGAVLPDCGGGGSGGGGGRGGRVRRRTPPAGGAPGAPQRSGVAADKPAGEAPLPGLAERRVRRPAGRAGVAVPCPAPPPSGWAPGPARTAADRAAGRHDGRGGRTATYCGAPQHRRTGRSQAPGGMHYSRANRQTRTRRQAVADPRRRDRTGRGGPGVTPCRPAAQQPARRTGRPGAGPAWWVVISDRTSVRAPGGASIRTMTTSENARNDDSLPLDVEIGALQGGAAELDQYAGRVVLVVNVASKCGLTPQYAGLERLQERYAEQGFTVLGVPCNQFMGQEPGSAEEIAEFCSATYGVSFPMTEKVEVNGEGRHPLYDRLTGFADAEGHSGDIRWNFEKFLIGRDGKVAARFAPQTEPEAAEVVAAVEARLAG